ncbi:MAG TPA: molybdopterin-dependent oxidoreductase [Thermodesulfobacteriota bacterium]
MPEIDRRNFLKIVGVGGAAAGATTLAGCSYPETYLVSSLTHPADDSIPGVPIYYATTCRECPAGCGLLATVREGRVIKVEGNPAHPISRGTSCALAQASLQGLYNPDRIRGPLARDGQGGFRQITWDEALKTLVDRLAELRRTGRGRAVFLTGQLSGSLDKLIDTWLARAAGGGRALAWEPITTGPLVAATRLAFGVEEVPRFDFARARYLVSFGADFLETWLTPVEQARGFAAMHAFDGRTRPGVFVAVEPRRSLTGSNADEWIAPRAGTEGLVALAMAHVIVNENLGPSRARPSDALRRALDAYSPQAVAAEADVPAETIERLARDFAQARPSLAVGGGAAAQGPTATATLVAVHVLNAVAGNVGETVLLGAGERRGGIASGKEMVDLVQAMNGGEVPALFVYGANPAYDTPAGLGFADAMAKVPFKVSFSSYLDETTARCDLVLPDRHFLESWGDAVPRDGVYGLVQPAMNPVADFDARPIGDVLIGSARASGEAIAAAFPQESFEAYLKAEWQALKERVEPRGDFEAWWRQALQRGGVFVDPPSGRRADLSAEVARALPPLAAPSLGEGDLTLVVYPSPNFRDGRGANRPWLQELPDPVTKITWWSWVEMHPETAARLGVRVGQEVQLDEGRGVLLPFPTNRSAIVSDVVALETPQGRIEAPVYLNPHIRPDTVAVALGQGHEQFGRYAQNRGTNPMRVLPATVEAESGAFTFVTKVKVSKTGTRRGLASIAGADDQRGRNIYKSISVADAEKGTVVAHDLSAIPGPAMLPPVAQDVPYHWGMTIDLDRCTGCQACVVACYAENNLPVVGEAQVARGREMSWIRIERYWEPDGTVTHAPMLCLHCGNAPCEPVCPVFAAYHNPEGLNGQVYNRCVGTRYCGNNCPYKVRYFNWYDYSRESYNGKPNPAYAFPAPLHLQLNPSVTVRGVGVMEKCTMCIQRINAAKDLAKDQGRRVRDGEFQTACAQACPTEAIVFGNLKDPESRVAKLRASPRNYAVLEELETVPSVTHLAKVTFAEAPAAGRGPEAKAH